TRTMNIPAISLPHLLAGAVSCVMAAIIAIEVVPSADEPATAIVAPAAGRKAHANRVPFQTAALAKATLERPLFTPGRHPAEEPEDADEDDEDEAPSPLEVRLAGVFIGPDHSEALFDKDGDETVAVPEGGEISGWTVDSIEIDRVVVSSTAGEKVLLPTPVDTPAFRAKRVAAAARKRAIASQSRAAAAQAAARNATIQPAVAARPNAPAPQPSRPAVAPAGAARPAAAPTAPA